MTVYYQAVFLILLFRLWIGTVPRQTGIYYAVYSRTWISVAMVKAVAKIFIRYSLHQCICLLLQIVKNHVLGFYPGQAQRQVRSSSFKQNSFLVMWPFNCKHFLPALKWEDNCWYLAYHLLIWKKPSCISTNAPFTSCIALVWKPFCVSLEFVWIH